MSKQDVTYSRTAEDLERKYNLGQIAQGGIGGDSGKISQALQELSDCKATISNMLRKINEIESQLGEGGNIVYLTQSEYDALPDSKLTDGVEYRITDAGIGETQASNVSYDNSNSGLEAINTQMAIDEINERLENENNESFNFGILNGVRGFFTNPSRADDCFIPFKNGFDGEVLFSLYGFGNYLLDNENFYTNSNDSEITAKSEFFNLSIPDYAYVRAKKKCKMTVISNDNALSNINNKIVEANELVAQYGGTANYCCFILAEEI